MANKNNQWLIDRYYKALTQLGKTVAQNETLDSYRSKWKALDKEFKARGEKRPSLKEASAEFDYNKTPRDNNMNTAPANVDLDEEQAKAILDTFASDIDTIYNDTIDFIAYYTRKGVSHDEGKLASIADARRTEIDSSYLRLKEKFETMREDIPPTILAQAISDNIELDYIISVTLMPPSDIQLEFDKTLAGLEALSIQIEARAQELAEQAEREYLAERKAEREYYGE